VSTGQLEPAFAVNALGHFFFREYLFKRGILVHGKGGTQPATAGKNADASPSRIVSVSDYYLGVNIKDKDELWKHIQYHPQHHGFGLLGGGNDAYKASRLVNMWLAQCTVERFGTTDKSARSGTKNSEGIQYVVVSPGTTCKSNGDIDAHASVVALACLLRAHILTGQIIHNSYGVAIMFRSGLV